MAQEGAKDCGLLLDGTGGTASVCGESDQVVSRIVGQRIGLEVGPQVLDGVEFRGIGRQVFKMSRAWRDAFIDELTEVRLETIPDEDDGRAQLVLQVLEKVHHTRGIDVGIGKQAKVERHAIACGADAQGGDGRDLLMTAHALPEYRGVPAQAPGAAHERSHQQSRFVEKDQRGVQAGGVFFTRGQSCSIQAWIRASSRSTARRVGFCGEKPSPCRSRLT